MKTALQGIRVIDFSAYASGPVCAMFLGDFGADVVKVEPLAGEGSRQWGVTRCGPAGDMSALFAAVNRNKRGIALDLKSQAGLALAQRLITNADVVLENMYPGATKRLGIDYESCRKLRPDIVYCSISGFGHVGPLRDQPGYDAALQAYAGMASITGEADRPSVRIGPSTVDFLTGAHAAFGIAVALRHRDATGEGQKIDLSLYDSALHYMTHWMVDCSVSGKIQPKCGAYFPFLAPSGNFFGADGEFHMSVSAGTMWVNFCKMIERPDLERHPRFADNDLRCQNSAALYAELVPIFRGKPVNYWLQAARTCGIVAAPVANVAQVLEQEQAHALDMILPIESAPGVNARSAGVPIHLSLTPGRYYRSAPSLGRDTVDVLGELGVAAEEIERLTAGGIIR